MYQRDVGNTTEFKKRSTCVLPHRIVLTFLLSIKYVLLLSLRKLAMCIGLHVLLFSIAISNQGKGRFVLFREF